MKRGWTPLEQPTSHNCRTSALASPTQIDFGDDPIHIIGSLLPCPPLGFVPVSGLSLSYFPIVTKYSASIGINLLFYYSCKKVLHSGERWTGAPFICVHHRRKPEQELATFLKSLVAGAVEFTNENGIGPFRVDGAPIRRWALGNLLRCLEKNVMAQISHDFLSSRRQTVHPMKTCQLLGLND
jgi:hypothetical protein